MKAGNNLSIDGRFTNIGGISVVDANGNKTELKQGQGKLIPTEIREVMLEIEKQGLYPSSYLGGMTLELRKDMSWDDSSGYSIFNHYVIGLRGTKSQVKWAAAHEFGHAYLTRTNRQLVIKAMKANKRVGKYKFEEERLADEVAYKITGLARNDVGIEPYTLGGSL